MKTLLSKIKKGTSLSFSFNYIYIILLIVSLVYTNSLMQKNKVLSNDLYNKINNIEAYEGMLSDANAKNNVLRLDMSTLHRSNDNLLHKLDSVREELKISDKALRTALIQQSTIEVSDKDTITINDSCEFTKVFKPNKLTVLNVEYKNDSLSYKLKISNDQYVYMYCNKDWKNKNKKFFKRLFSWDWKKITYYKYEIVNTNNLIEVGKTRVIENIESK